MYTIMGIRRTSRSARKLNPAAKFILWYDMYELGGHDNDDVNDIIRDPDYVSTEYIFSLHCICMRISLKSGRYLVNLITGIFALI